MLDMALKFGEAFIPLFVAMDPLGMVPVFLGLTRDLGRERRRRVNNQATLTAAGVALGFMLVGKAVLKALGITVADFQVAGGLVILVLAIRDLMGGPSLQPEAAEEVGVVPLGLPLIVGPATLAMLLILMDSVGWLLTLAALAANLIILNLAFRFAAYLSTHVGTRGLLVVYKITSLLLAAFAVSIIRRGL